MGQGEATVTDAGEGTVDARVVVGVDGTRARATHLGSTGRMVLLHSHCPVRVVTADRVDRGSGPSLETPGSARRTRVPV